MQVADILVTVRDAAKLLALSERKLWELTAGGQVPCVRVGRCVRYRPEDLQHWALSKRQGGAP